MLTLISIPWCHALLPSILALTWDYLFRSKSFAGFKDVLRSWDRGGAVSTPEDQCSNWQLSRFLISSFSGPAEPKVEKGLQFSIKGKLEKFHCDFQSPATSDQNDWILGEELRAVSGVRSFLIFQMFAWSTHCPSLQNLVCLF